MTGAPLFRSVTEIARRETVAEVVLDAVAVVLEPPDGFRLDGSARFDELGADSIARVVLADEVEALVAVRLDLRIHLDDGLLDSFRDVDQLVAHVLTRLPEGPA